MSITQHQPEAGSATESNTANLSPAFGTGRSEFVVVAVLYAVAILLTIGTATMNVQGKSAPGPQFFPIIVCIVLYLVATLLAIQILRSPKVPDNSIHPGHGQFSADMLHDLGHLGKEEDEAYDDAPAPTPCQHLEDVLGLADGRTDAGRRRGLRRSAGTPGLDHQRSGSSGSSPTPSAATDGSSTSAWACSSPQSFNWPSAPGWASACPPAS
jgi:hypothetical protein